MGAGPGALPRYGLTHRKQWRWYSLPSARYRCTRCTCCWQAAHVLLGALWAPCSDRLPEDSSSLCREWRVTSHVVPEHPPALPVISPSWPPALRRAPSFPAALYKDRSPMRGRSLELSPPPRVGCQRSQRGQTCSRSPGGKHENPVFWFLRVLPPDPLFKSQAHLPGTVPWTLSLHVPPPPC